MAGNATHDRVTITVRNKKESKALQEELFSLGYRWRLKPHWTVKNTERPAIVINAQGELGYYTKVGAIPGSAKIVAAEDFLLFI